MKRIAIIILVLLFPVLAGAQRLPRTILPQHYELRLAPDFQQDKMVNVELEANPDSSRDAFTLFTLKCSAA